MKIEKVNENQIRCTLTREDLASRELKISELAYGTEKAKTLFRDMMQQANYQFGFEAEDIPLMIEAIPLNAECIVLIITKVEDPEELDTRFSRFAPSVHDSDEDEDDDSDDDVLDGPDEVMDLFRRIHESHKASVDTDVKRPAEPDEDPALTRIFLFGNLDTVLNASSHLGQAFSGLSALYKEESSGKYLLTITRGEASLADFNRACNLLSEYGHIQKNRNTGLAYLEEHYEPLIRKDALQTLAKI